MEIQALPPYVSPEHKEVIKNGEIALKNYEDFLAGQLRKHYNLNNEGCIKASDEDIYNAHRDFKYDPIRKKMIDQISILKLMYERPRLLVNNPIV